MRLTRILGLLALGCFLAGMAPRRGVWVDYELVDSKIDPERLCRAIYIAEGGDKASKPYGILNGLIEDEPGHASYYCKEIIRKSLGMWNGRGSFIEYLGSSYCPPKAHRLNRNWVRNTKYWYDKLSSKKTDLNFTS